MKTKYLMISLAALALCGAAGAQDFGGILAQIEENNSTLRVLRSEAGADKMEARTGLTPSDPEVELGYLWETVDPEGGTRVDFSVSQSFDFPSVYYWRKRISRGECAAADYAYAIGRKRILLEAKQICIDLVYRNALKIELDKCLLNAKTIADSWQSKFDTGGAGALELNKAKMALLSASRTAKNNEIERQALLADLQRLNGGHAVEFSFSEFAVPFIPDDFEQWYNDAASRSSEILAVENDLRNAESGVKLAASEWFPKFSIGYMSESVSGSSFQGITGGISIPLWENSGKVRAAKARREAAEEKVKDDYLQFHLTLKGKYAKALSLISLREEYRNTLSGLNPGDMLYEALSSGEISVEEYTMEMEVWYDALQDALECERDCHSLIAEIESFAE